MIHRGEIYWVNLDPTVGAEINKTRPALIISNDRSNAASHLVTILPITSQIERIYPWEVRVSRGMGGLKEDGKIKTNQMRTVDKKRLVGNPLGPQLHPDIMKEVAIGLKIHLDLN